MPKCSNNETLILGFSCPLRSLAKGSTVAGEQKGEEALFTALL